MLFRDYDSKREEHLVFSEEENTFISFLCQIKKVLDNHKIEFWLDCGTLLGVVRDGRFIPGEHDIDLGVWQNKISDGIKISISRELTKKGFDVYLAENWITIKKSEEIWADIASYRLINNKAVIPKLEPQNLSGKFLTMFIKILSAPYYYQINFRSYRQKNMKRITRLIRDILVVISRILPSWLKKRIIKVALIIYKKMGPKNVSWIIPSNYFRNLTEIRFHGIKFRVPDKTEEYLAYRYGKDWRIPKKDWVTERDDGAVIKHLS